MPAFPADKKDVWSSLEKRLQRVVPALNRDAMLEMAYRMDLSVLQKDIQQGIDKAGILSLTKIA
jgi:hypothetical protein